MDETYASHGCYYNRNNGEKRLNFENPIKRIFLSDCIRQLHIMNGNKSPKIRMPVQYNKLVIWNKVNSLLRPVPLTERQLLLQKVRRRLFIDSKKQRPHKRKKPKRNTSHLSEANHFKSRRYYLGIRKIPRNYLDRREHYTQDYINQTLKRRRTVVEDVQQMETSPLNLSTSVNKCQFGQFSHVEERIKRMRRCSEVCRVSRRARKLEETLFEQQYRQLSVANDRYLEASIRSTLYMKALMGIVATEQIRHSNYV